MSGSELGAAAWLGALTALAASRAAFRNRWAARFVSAGRCVKRMTLVPYRGQTTPHAGPPTVGAEPGDR
jgi:hypothetical protein